jgi:hypothetical protein
MNSSVIILSHGGEQGVSDVVDQSELRGWEVKLEHNKKQLAEAENKGLTDKITILKKNIKHYEKLLGINT